MNKKKKEKEKDDVGTYLPPPITDGGGLSEVAAATEGDVNEQLADSLAEIARLKDKLKAAEAITTNASYTSNRLYSVQPKLDENGEHVTELIERCMNPTEADPKKQVYEKIPMLLFNVTLNLPQSAIVNGQGGSKVSGVSLNGAVYTAGVVYTMTQDKLHQLVEYIQKINSHESSTQMTTPEQASPYTLNNRSVHIPVGQMIR